MLYYVMRPSDKFDPSPLFTRYWGLSKRLVGARARAEKCSGRVYSTDGGESILLHDYFVPPTSTDVAVPFKVWRARMNQAALFA